MIFSYQKHFSPKKTSPLILMVVINYCLPFQWLQSNGLKWSVLTLENISGFSFDQCVWSNVQPNVHDLHSHACSHFFLILIYLCATNFLLKNLYSNSNRDLCDFRLFNIAFIVRTSYKNDYPDSQWSSIVLRTSYGPRVVT